MGVEIGEQVNRTGRKIAEARENTRSLRQSSETWWPRLRELLRELEIDPNRAAIGDMFQEQLGPFVVLVTAEGRIVTVQLELLDVHDYSKIAISHAMDRGTSESRFPYPLGVYAAEAILEEEIPGSFDPIAVLAEEAGKLTDDMRQSRDWERIREFLSARGIDPTQAILAHWQESWKADVPALRTGFVLSAGEWFTFTAAVELPGGPIAQVTEWEQVGEREARAVCGDQVDGALRLASSAGRGSS